MVGRGWVAAAAGTGKTKVLTDRVLSLLVAGTPPARLLCLTFTKAAAAEMANRIADRLGHWATCGEDELADQLAALSGGPPDAAAGERARRLFAQVLDTPGGLKIQTIHAFCQSLLRRFPLEAGVAPHFAVMDELDAREMLTAAQEVVLQQARHGGDEALAAALAELTRHVQQSAFQDLMVELAAERGRLHRLIEDSGGVAPLVERIRARLDLAPGDDEASIVAAASSEAVFDGNALPRAAAAMLEGSRTDRARGQAIADWLAAVPEVRAARFDDYLAAFFTDRGAGPRLATLAHKDALARCPDAADVLADEAARLEAVRDRLRACAVARASAALVSLGDAMLRAYERHKIDRALLDYDDLILATSDLLGGRRHGLDGAAAWVLYKLDGGIDHILIDEAQDTNPDQWRVVQALAEEFFAGEGARAAIRTLFVVGDAKQSIYSFQRADPDVFAAMRRFFKDRIEAAARRWADVSLDLSFRSTRAVLDAVDAVFATAAAADGVVTPGERLHHRASRAGHGGCVEIWPAVEPRRSDERPPWKPPVEREPGDSPRARLARLIARRIRAWLDRGEILEARNRPVRAGDIMVLVRRRGGFVEELVRELKQLEVKVAGVDRMMLTEQLAVMDLIALGRFLLMPEDDLTLATVLKSPLVGLDEAALFRLAHGRDGSLWRALRRQAGDDPGFAAAHDPLAGLLGRADTMPPFELYAAVLGADGNPDRPSGRRRLVARLGYEADDPIDEFLALALAYQRHHPPSLEGFLHWLESGRVEVKRDLEQSERDEVRVMTVHGAKGLQAPIVILPDTLQTPRKGPALLWLDDGSVLWPPRRALYDPVSEAARAAAERRRDREYRRLLYVAMTRAEDRLYVCGWHTKQAAPDGCWYTLIRAALADRASPIEDRFLTRELGDSPATVLRLSRPQTIAPAAEAATAVPPAAPELPPFALAPPPPEPAPPRPLAPSRPAVAEPAVRSPLGDDDGERFRRGLVIHRLLQSLPELPAEARRPAAERFLARAAPGLDAAALADEACAVLETPAFAPLFAPGSRAEVPIVGRLGDTVVSGQVDRLAVTAGEVLIVDYKTGRSPPRSAPETPLAYLRQMAAYRALVRAIYPDKSVRCALVWTDGPRLLALPEALLNAHAPPSHT
jgi:ATP-dependent helicase/nuclease subunit A